MHGEGKHVELYDVGLRVNPTLSYLGASLDKGVFDPSCENTFGGLEVKPALKQGTWASVLWKQSTILSSRIFFSCKVMTKG